VNTPPPEGVKITPQGVIFTPFYSGAENNYAFLLAFLNKWKLASALLSVPVSELIARANQVLSADCFRKKTKQQHNLVNV
jgi:hypothetical protein